MRLRANQCLVRVLELLVVVQVRAEEAIYIAHDPARRGASRSRWLTGRRMLTEVRAWRMDRGAARHGARM